MFQMHDKFVKKIGLHVLCVLRVRHNFGYTNGYGSKEQFLSEKDGLKLSNKVVEYIMKKIDEERNRA